MCCRWLSPTLNSCGVRLRRAVAAVTTVRQTYGTQTSDWPGTRHRYRKLTHHECVCRREEHSDKDDEQNHRPHRPIAPRAVGLAAPSPADGACVAQPPLVPLRALLL